MNKIKPILFTTEMVKAIKNGNKVSTRRLWKGGVFSEPVNELIDNENRTYAIRTYCDSEHLQPESLIEVNLPICKGDILYVRETWCDPTPDKCGYPILYKADMPIQWNEDLCVTEKDYKWSPSLHMPRDAARIFLQVTNVKFERLQDMTLDDFLKEGVVIRPEAFNDPENAYWQARNEFERIWDSTLNKKEKTTYGWDANPFVMVIDFIKGEKPEGF